MNFTQMLNEEEEDKEDEEDYKRNLIVKLDHLLEQPQEICKKIQTTTDRICHTKNEK